MDSFQNMNHTVIDSHMELDSSWVTVMYRAMRFHITVSHKEIQRSRFVTEYSEMMAKVIDDDDEEDHDVLCEWIVDPCLPYFRESTLNVPHNNLWRLLLPTDASFEALGFGILTLSQGHSRSWDYERFPSDDTVRRPSTFLRSPSFEGIGFSNHFRYKMGRLYVQDTSESCY
jgi:hypothetical protein